MEQFTLSAMIAGIPLSCATFGASGESDAIGFGRGYVEALCEIRPEFEIGSRWRVDRLVLRGNKPFMDETTLVAECEVVERDGQVRAIWRVPAPPSKASRH